MKEEPRIGVFVCHCGVNIGGVVYVPDVVKYAKDLPYVVHSEGNLYTCSEVGLNSIKDAIQKYNLNRVVVASCTPRTHEPLFKSTCEEAGLNPYLFEMVNIREQCSWVHYHEPKEATEKAKDLVRMAVAKAVWLEPQEEPVIDLKDSALVIGAGTAGMTAALTLADQGFKVYLLEKEQEIGGNLRRLYKVYPTLQDASEILDPMVKAVKEHENIELLTSTTVSHVDGYVGNFSVEANKKGEKVKLEVGTIIVACGALNYEPPKGLYQYGVYDGVMTQLELEEILREERLEKPERVVIIQCVGARKGEVRPLELSAFPKSDSARLLRKILRARKEEGWPYCCKIGCVNAIKNAMLIKNQYPETDIIILYGDLRVYKEYENLYADARSLEVKFVRYIEEATPDIRKDPEGKLTVRVYDAITGKEVDFPCDWVVLTTPLIPHRDQVLLSGLLKVPLSSDGFLMEAHLKLRPVDTQMDGIFIAGAASGPKDLQESIISAKAAAARAAILMASRKMKVEAITATVDLDLCRGCGRCEEVCEFKAINIKEVSPSILGARVNDVLCRGCGTCAVTCPTGAITMRCFTDKHIYEMLKAVIKRGGVQHWKIHKL